MITGRSKERQGIANILLVVSFCFYKIGGKMRIRETTFKAESNLIIYITEEESNNNEIISRIDEYKKKYKSISIFISGKADIKGVLKKMIIERSEISNHY